MLLSFLVFASKRMELENIMKVFIKKTCWILSSVIFFAYRHEHVVFLFGNVK